jgi:elongation factor G
MKKNVLVRDFEVQDIPSELKEEADAAHEHMMEALSETDDEFLEKFISGETISPEEIRTVIRKATLDMEIFPVLGGSAFKNKGVQPLLDAVVYYLPSPLEVKAITGSKPGATKEEEGGLTRKAENNDPFSALAFKILSDPYVGVLTFFQSLFRQACYR